MTFLQFVQHYFGVSMHSFSSGTIEMDFGKFFERVDKEKFTWVAWDPPGYGKSRPPPRDFTGSYGHRDGVLVGKMMEVCLWYEYNLFSHNLLIELKLMFSNVFNRNLVTTNIQFLVGAKVALVECF